MDWYNCLHVACTEVRASNLSGECTMVSEFNRGNFGIKGQGEECVKRRAARSVGAHKHCGPIARAAVESVFAKCHLDHAPFVSRQDDGEIGR